MDFFAKWFHKSQASLESDLAKIDAKLGDRRTTLIEDTKTLAQLRERLNTSEDDKTKTSTEKEIYKIERKEPALVKEVDKLEESFWGKAKELEDRFHVVVMMSPYAREGSSALQETD